MKLFGLVFMILLVSSCFPETKPPIKPDVIKLKSEGKENYSIIMVDTFNIEKGNGYLRIEGNGNEKSKITYKINQDTVYIYKEFVLLLKDKK